jgi:hypothetical protein
LCTISNDLAPRFVRTLTFNQQFFFLFLSQLENMAFFYSELALVQYTMLIYRPSMTAAAAVYAARSTLGMNPLWTDILEYHTGLTEPQLLYVLMT